MLFVACDFQDPSLQFHCGAFYRFEQFGFVSRDLDLAIVSNLCHYTMKVARLQEFELKHGTK